MGRAAALWWRSAVLVVMLAATVLPRVAGAQELRLTLPEARTKAAQLLAQGQPEAALILAQGVLLGAPGDVPALVLKSRALRDMGRNEEAIAVAREAREAAATDKDHFFAALVMAQARASNGQRGVAQYWLRRAAQIAPDDGLRAVAVRDFRHVRRTTPWRAKLAFSISPSSNINGAPKTNSFTLGGFRFVNPAAVPLSGLRFGVNGSLRYTIPMTARSRIHLGFGASVERVRLSSDSRAKVPMARDRDYAKDAVEARLEWETIGPEADWIGRVALVLARDWEGGALLSDAARLELGYSRAVGQGIELGIETAFEAQKRHDFRLRDSRSRSVTLRGTKLFADASRLQLDLTAIQTDSDSAVIANDTRRAVLSYGLGKPVMGVLPQIALSRELVDFARPIYGTAARRDDVRGVSVNLLLPEMDYYGFAPEIGVSFSDRRSNYSLFESESTDLRLGVRSVF